jgi:phosphohistidine phosphatase
MKTLLLIRHAKSSWEVAGTGDFDRPLNERGKADAPMMARRLAERKLRIDCIMASPAKRTKKTAELFGRQFHIDEKQIHFVPDLYHGGPEAYIAAILALDKDCLTMALVAHNPGITEFANSITDQRIDNIPTCGIFAVTAKIEKWSRFADAKKNFLFFDYPKSG